MPERFMRHNENILCLKKLLLPAALLFFIFCSLTLPLTHERNSDAEAAYSLQSDDPLFYSYEQLVARLNHIKSVSGGKVQLEVIGESNQGRDIYMATTGTGAIPVMIVTQMHGNEPHGTQAVLDIMEDLVTSDDPVSQNILEELTIYIVPRLNPDGSEPGIFQRRNIDPLAPPRLDSDGRYSMYKVGWDLNRFHIFDWVSHTLSNYSEFSLMTDKFGLVHGRTFNGSVEHSGEQGLLIDCGKGLGPEDFPPEVAGNIAMVERGGATFNAKSANAQAAGAIGFILYQEDPSETQFPRFNLSSPPDIPATVITRSTALQIINSSQPVTGQFITYTYPENPATETRHFVEAVKAVDPLWLIDVHNQGSYISPQGKTVTSSVLWGTNSRVCPVARELAQQICVVMSDCMEQYNYAEVTLYPSASGSFASTSGYGIEGIASVLLEIWNNYTNPRIAELLIEHTYVQLFSTLANTADGSLFEIDAGKATGISARGVSTSRSNAETVIEPYLPLTPEELQKAVQALINEIYTIPVPITMEDTMTLRLIRHKTELLLEEGASESDVVNLANLEAAEEALEDLYWDNYLRQSILALNPPAPEDNQNLTWFVRNRDVRWWDHDDRIDGLSFRPLGMLSIAYINANEPRWAEYDISGRGYSHVQGYVGIADHRRQDYPVTFEIHADGDLIYQETLEWGKDAKFYLLDIQELDKLRFGWYAPGATDDGVANQIIVVEPYFLIPITPEVITAIHNAEQAIAELPDHISLMDEELVKDVRDVVDQVLVAGVEEERLQNLERLLDAEETIHNLYHQLYELESLHLLGDPGSDNRNSGWLVEFDNPERWSVHTEPGERGFVNFKSFEPLKVFTAGLSRIATEPIYAQWDISNLDYTYLEGYFGMSDATSNAVYPLDFRIYGDDSLLFESHQPYGRDAAFYRINVEDVTWLRLQYSAEQVSDSNYAGWPVFVEPVFLHSPKTTEAAAAAEDAIAALPPAVELTLQDEDAVKEARSTVKNALAIGTPEQEIANLSVLEAAETRISELIEAAGMRGDVDGNGIINMGDVIFLLRHITGLTDLEQTLGIEALIRARVSSTEGYPGIEDAVLIMQKVLGILSEFPADQS